MMNLNGFSDFLSTWLILLFPILLCSLGDWLEIEVLILVRNRSTYWKNIEEIKFERD